MNAATATTRNGMMPGDLWQRYRDTADPSARRQLLDLYIGLVLLLLYVLFGGVRADIEIGRASCRERVWIPV